MNIATDLALAAVPTLMIIPLQIRSSKRAYLLIAFWCRIMYVHIVACDGIMRRLLKVIEKCRNSILCPDQLHSLTHLIL